MRRAGLSRPRAVSWPEPRAAERRVGIHDLLREVTFEMAASRDRARLLDSLLERVSRLLAVRQVRLTTLGEASALRTGQPVRAADYIACAVTRPAGGRQLVLEASFDPARGLDGWSVQLLEDVAALAAWILEIERLSREVQPVPGRRDGAAPLVGSSALMQALRARIERVAATDFTVLVEGESGTGKELVARQVHELSRRRAGPFVAVNCAALVETLIEAELFGIEERTATGVRGRRGKFEVADGGTLFLDEVSELSMAAQAKLLRAIQDLAVERVGGATVRRVDTRIIAATNRRLASLVERGVFRADLFYRLAGVEVQVPPLRQRRGDVLELAHYFLARHAVRGGRRLSPAAVDALGTYDWPGNVRELERMIEGAIATAGLRDIELDDLPLALRGPYSEILMPAVMVDASMRAWGSRYARLVLERAGGNKTAACRLLDISYHTLNAYLRYRPREGQAPPGTAELAPAEALPPPG
ncbi:MAG: sigma-54 interaction domain-containing protein [Vicinamibacterales bacterium]